MAGLFVWRNWVKSFSERRPGVTPAMRLGLETRPYTMRGILAQRLFPSRVGLPAAWEPYYWRRCITRAGRNGPAHRRRFAA
jgi:hypothetical protein